MDTERVPHLDWPADLFRDAVAVDVTDDLENPFWEPGDYVAETWLATQPEHVPCPGYAMAE